MSQLRKTYRLALVLIMALLCSLASTAQDNKPWEKHGHKSFEEGDFYGAAWYFKKALKNDSSSLENLWMLAESLRKINDYEAASETYRKVIDRDEKLQYDLAVFHYAQMRQNLADYEEAASYYDIYKDIAKDRSSFYYKRAKQGIKQCEWALMHREDSTSLTIEHPGLGLNSFDAEFAPYFVNDTTLYFSALRYDSAQTKKLKGNFDAYHARMYEAVLSEENWTVTPFDSLFNTPGTDNSNPVLSPDSNRMYFTRCIDGDCGIYVSFRKAGQWSTPEKLPPVVNVEDAVTTHPFVAEINGKEYLFYASNRPRTRGKMDIWYVELKNNGKKTGRPKNAGRAINTKDDEITPYYDTASLSLFFSSKWHNGFGGYDIFKAKGLPGKFSDPENAGKPVNTSSNDLYYSFRSDLNKGALVSNREGGYAMKGETCCNDIYLVKPFEAIDSTPKPVVPDTENLVVMLRKIEFLPLALYFDNDRPNPRSRATRSDLAYDETYRDYLKRKPEYERESPDRTAIDSFFVYEVETGYHKLQMLADSLVKYLGRGYKLQLGIKGYTSPLGDAKYNDNLASRRISTIENYLMHYKDGVLKPYIDEGLFKFRRIPYGEFFSAGKVSDDLKKQSYSVYSKGAAEARKVEIIWVDQRLPGDSSAVIIFEHNTFDFGEVKEGELQSHIFRFTNSGESDLLIEAVETGCGCTVVKYDTIPIAPGESGSVTVLFDTRNRKGMQFKAIVVRSNATVPEQKLFIRAMVRP